MLFAHIDKNVYYKFVSIDKGMHPFYYHTINHLASSVSLNFTLCESNFFATSYYLEKISCRVFREAFLQWSARKWFGLLERWMYVVYDFIEGTGYLRSLSGVSIWTDDSDEEDCGFTIVLSFIHRHAYPSNYEARVVHVLFFFSLEDYAIILKPKSKRYKGPTGQEKKNYKRPNIPNKKKP
ncbi:hypothetical protein YC2023_071109 [Brassica napus]